MRSRECLEYLGVADKASYPTSQLLPLPHAEAEGLLKVPYSSLPVPGLPLHVHDLILQPVDLPRLLLQLPNPVRYRRKEQERSDSEAHIAIFREM